MLGTLVKDRSTAGIVALAISLSVVTAAATVYKPGLAVGVAFVAVLIFARSLEARLAVWLVIRLLSFSGYISLTYGEVALALVVASALLQAVTSRRTLRLPALPILWAAFASLTLINLLYFGFPTESVTYDIEVVFENFGLLVMLANSENGPRQTNRAIWVVAFTILGIGLFSGLEYAAGHPLLTQLSSARIAYLPTVERATFQGTQRLGSILFNPDWLAAAMALGCVLWVGLAIASRGPKRWLSVSCALVLLAVATTTLNRAVFVGVPAGLLALILINSKTRVHALYVFAIMAIPIATVTGSQLAQTALFRLQNLAPIDYLRVGAAQTAIRVIFANPLFGLGTGWERYLTKSESYRTSLQTIPLAHPHNSFLEVGAMLGLPALAVVLALVAVPMWRSLITRHATPGMAAPFAGVTVLAVMSLTVNVITLPFLGTLFWTLWWILTEQQQLLHRRPSPLVDTRQASQAPRTFARAG